MMAMTRMERGDKWFDFFPTASRFSGTAPNAPLLVGKSDIPGVKFLKAECFKINLLSRYARTLKIYHECPESA